MTKVFAGIADDEFIRGDIPMTKQEVRVLALNKARIAADNMILDIGAGTGSFSVEAALQASCGKVYAIEREPEGVELIHANAAKFNAANIEIILGAAPAALAHVPPVDVIFIGGSGGYLHDILLCCDQLLKAGGRIVITAVTLETLHDALHLLSLKSGYQVEAFGVQVTRIRPVAKSNMFQALNPVYIITGTKGGNCEG